MTKTVSTFPGRDGFVHWEGCNRGIPRPVATAIQALSHDATRATARLQLKSALRQSGFSLSRDELQSIFEREFGMSRDVAKRTADFGLSAGY